MVKWTKGTPRLSRTRTLSAVTRTDAGWIDFPVGIKTMSQAIVVEMGRGDAFPEEKLGVDLKDSSTL